MAQENNKWEFAQIGRNEFGQLLIINDTRKVEMNFRDCLTLLEAKGIMFDILSVPELQSKVKELEERNKVLEDALRKIDAISFHKNDWEEMCKIGEIAKEALLNNHK